jgi:hypothetical protein
LRSSSCDSEPFQRCAAIFRAWRVA